MDQPLHPLERSTVYLFLSRAYSHVPDSDYLSVSAEVAKLFESLCPEHDFAEIFRQSLNDLDKIGLEYSCLFVGPPPEISLLESCHKNASNPELFGQEALDVKRILDHVGLNVKAGFFGLFDHISVELELMGQLLAIVEGAEVRDSFNLQHYLFNEHLKTWAPDFSARLSSLTPKGSFYNAVACLTGNLLLYDKPIYEHGSLLIDQTVGSVG